MLSYDYWKIAKSLFFFYISWSAISYYFGYGKFDDEQEQQRRERVEKYGVLLIIASITAFLSGALLLYSTISHANAN